MNTKILIVVLLINGLDGQCLDNQNQINDKTSLEKVLFSPIIIKGKIKSLLETSKYIEINLKVLKIYKGPEMKLFYLRLKFDKCQWKKIHLELGSNAIFYLSEHLRPTETPDLFNKQLRKIVKKYACNDCSKLKKFLISIIKS